MLKRLRIILAILFWSGITLLLLDFTGTLHGWLGWMAKVQFLPAVMALNAAVIVALILLTLLFGRIYCSVICPLGVFQDGVAHIGAARARRKKKPHYGWSPEKKWLRYGMLAMFVIALIAGVQAFVAILAPYSAWGRIVQSLFQPVYIWINNLFALAAERAGSYAFYSKEVWLRSLPTLIVAALTLVTVIVLAWIGGRTWCNTVCPVGTTLGFISRFSMFRPVIDKAKCKDCKACERSCKASCIHIDAHEIDYSRCVDCFDCIGSCKFDALRYRFAWGKGGEKIPGTSPGMTERTSPGMTEGGSGKTDGGGSDRTEGTADAGRRAFLAGAAVAVGTAALRAQGKKVDGGLAAVLDKEVPTRDIPLTPPGSKSVKDFYRRCTACQLCVAECPNNVLRPSSTLEHLMQPEMSYERGWCRPECTRCAELCPSGAIRKIAREEKTQYHIGTARIDRSLCIAEEGRHCGNCAVHCPAGAIQMVAVEGRKGTVPSVNETLCIGCGACENLCPARPISAITVNGRLDHLND